MSLTEPSSATGKAPAAFQPTQWGVVLAAQDPTHPRAQQALAKLCEAYWFPLYTFIRRRGYSPEEAKDLTQEFFARLLEKKYLQQADSAKGRFRTFLLTALTHFLSNEWNRGQMLKRGGAFTMVSWDMQWAEARYAQEPHHDLTPERIFERRWATTLLEQAHQRLGKEYATAGKVDLFEKLQGCLSGGRRGENYKEIGTMLGLSEGAVKVAVHRMRRRFGELLRHEIAQTVRQSDQVDTELRELLGVLAG